MSPVLRRALAALAALAVVVLTAACVTIPTSGGISQRALRGIDDSPDVNFLADGPARGDSQEDILRGFVRAGIDTRNRYGTAREFLTDDLAGKWNPYGGVLVTDASRGSVARLGATVASYTVRVTAKVDASGLYSTGDGTTSTALSFSFRKVKGQWRISAAPDGTILSPYNFSLLFAGYPLYFLDPSRAYLVPDLRWFLRDDSAAERIVRALLAGPASWLGSGAVLTSFPKGTQLGSDGVVIDGGTADVDLSSDVLGEDAATRRRMVAQLRASLDEVGTIASVRLTVRGFPVDVPAGSDSGGPTMDPQVLTTPVAASSTAIGTVGSSGLQPIQALSAKTIAVTPRAATLDRTRTTIAALGSAGTWRVPASGDAVLLDPRAGQVAPSIDPEGFVWTAQSSGSDSLAAIDGRGQVHPVTSASVVGGALIAFRLSRDGARIAMAISTDDGPVLEVAAIQRDANLVPTAIGPPLVIPVDDASSVLDLAWSDPTTVALLVRSDATTAVRTQQVGGQSATIGSVDAALQVVGGNGGTDGLRVLTSNGSVLQQTGAGGWQTTGAGGISFLVVQQ